ncbi:IclR family transcriptional regulator [Halomonas sp. HAL1]|uniref:IclR family transcriptional regulator n=1 Tax=Halomonas sp. HAL1 TaxID=550984 RepID=UPI00022D2C10|nr:IclR family transcriptional regulator C-terminal domain-containing protein [Halomonas sp. HAL1]EHA17530.1 IclR family transcriptional regulator [Halomonas sp. HAL1]WKV92678.1 IclR family transcriptional regulator C-terminal domain-containing protein [Halomonas sp. HAL1]
MAKDDHAARGIKSIAVGGRLLQALIDSSKPLTLREIAARAEITPAQAHAYLVSLKRVSMVVQQFESGPYLLGPMALQVGLSRLRSLAVFRRASTLLKELSNSLNVMSVLSVWGAKGPTAVMVVQARDKRSDLNIRMGTQFSVLNSATGRVFAAFENPLQVKMQLKLELERNPPPNYQTEVQSMEKYWEQIESIREQGFSTIQGLRVPGIDAVSVPIFDEHKEFTGAVTCVGHTDTLDIEPAGESIPAILAGVRYMHLATAQPVKHST